MSNIAKRAQNQPTKTPQVEGDKYTVLLLDEDQLDRFLNRPRFKSLSSHLSRTVDVWPRGHRARLWATAAAVAVLAVAVVWLGAAGEPKAPAATRPAPRIVKGPPMATGASFSVNVTSFSRDADARIMAGRLTKEGLPSFAWRLNGGLRDVLVGPFVSIDEAEAAQRSVARLGYKRTRLHVDERLRSTDAVVAADEAKASPAVVLVAAPGRLAVAFELSEEPQQVSGRRIDSTTFAVTASAGPVIQAQEWNAPSDVQLVKHVSVAADPRGLQGLDARVTVAENAVATMRLQGTRVYVDVSRAQLDFDEQPAPASPIQQAAEPAPAPVPPPARAAGPVQPRPARSLAMPATATGTATSVMVPTAPPVVGPRAAAASQVNEAQYRQAIGPVFARFEEIQPFLRSAVTTPTPEVLAAISGTFAELEQTLRVADIPRSSQGAHGLLTSAVQLARGAVAPSFSGDRMAQVREANAQFQAAKAQLR
ncbi:MAG TPA: SPOR domain-containing protein [Vicinamibacterales bacterium]|nr:SPOR domain-containing protein [Vicinamibacterales bacterium]